MSSYYEKMLATGEVKCIDEEVPFEIPQGWEWCRLNDLYNFIDYRGATPHKLSKGIPLITAKNVKQGYLDYTVKDFISSEEYSNRLSRGVSHKGDILFTTEAPLGNVAIADLDVYSAGQRLITFQAYIQCFTNNDMFMFFMLSPLFQELVMSYKTGTTVAGIKASKLKEVLIPTPPISEQSRIVKKLQTLLPFIEKYSRSQTLLNIFNTEIKDKLRKSFLQEAIRGKLVPQIAEDGTAQELLEQIKAEKQELVKEGKLKRSALNDSIIFRGDDNRYYEKIGKKIVCIEDEVPFEIPNSWVWARLGAIVDFSKSQTISSSMLDMDSWILDLEDIEKDSGRLLQKKRMKDLLSKSDKHLFYKGNVLYSKLRPYLNKVIVADEDGACTTEILAFDFGHIYNKYAQAYLMSHFFVDYANSDSYGIKMPRLGSKRGNNALFPLPPFKEQQRIVAQIEKLFEQLH